MVPKAGRVNGPDVAPLVASGATGVKYGTLCVAALNEPVPWIKPLAFEAIALGRQSLDVGGPPPEIIRQLSPRAKK
jgi:hypothetical protein